MSYPYGMPQYGYSLPVVPTIPMGYPGYQPPMVSIRPAVPAPLPVSIPNVNTPLKPNPALTPVTLYVGKIPLDMPDDLLKSVLDACGKVNKWTRINDPETGQLKSFGFCEFAGPKFALRALRLLKTVEFQGNFLLFNVGEKTQQILDEYEISVGLRRPGRPNQNVDLDPMTLDEDDQAMQVIRSMIKERIQKLVLEKLNADIKAKEDKAKQEKDAAMNAALKTDNKTEDGKSKSKEDDDKKRRRDDDSKKRRTRSRSGDRRKDDKRSSRSARDRTRDRRDRSRDRNGRHKDSHRDRDRDRDRRDRDKDSKNRKDKDKKSSRRGSKSRSLSPGSKKPQKPKSRSSSPEEGQVDSGSGSSKKKTAEEFLQSIAPEAVAPVVAATPPPPPPPPKITLSIGKMAPLTKRPSALGDEIPENELYTRKKLELVPMIYTPEELAEIPVPKDKESLFKFPIDWKTIDALGLLEKKVKPFVVKLCEDYFGQVEDELVNFIMGAIEQRKPAIMLQSELEAVMTDKADAEANTVKLWKHLAQVTRGG